MRSGKAINTTVLINDMIVDLCNESTPEKGLCFSPEYFKFITELKRFSFANIYSHWRLEEFQTCPHCGGTGVCPTCDIPYRTPKAGGGPTGLHQF